MKTNELRWARRSFALAVALIVQAALPAQATQKHLLKKGESIFVLAQRNGVSVEDILKANNISNPTNVRDGVVLLIPDAPKPTVASTTMSAQRMIGADRVSVRIHPDPNAPRVDMFDKGVPIIATAKKDGWVQVQLADGRSGWVRQDFVGLPRKGIIQTASNDAPKPKPSRPAPHREAVAVDDRRQKVRKWAQARQTETVKRTTEKWRKYARASSKRWAKKAYSGERQVIRREWTPERHQPTSRVARYTPEASAPAVGGDLTREALSYRGTPYRYGGAARGGFDCSGFTSYLYGKRGVGLPHSASGQARQGKAISKGDLKEGDLVFFQTVTKGISHVGVYLGNGKFVHSSSRRSGGVRVDSLGSGYYNQRFRGARRLR